MTAHLVAPLALTTAILGVAASAQVRRPAATIDPLREFSMFERDLATASRQASEADDLERLLREAPSAPGTIRKLLEHNRVPAVLEALPAALQRNAEDVIATLEAVSERASRFSDDRSRDYTDRLAAVVPLARARLAGFEREQAASAASALVGIELQIGQAAGRGNAWTDRLREFVQAYPGTKAAALAAIDVAVDRMNVRERVAELDRIWKANPASAVGAKALYKKGFELHTLNVYEDIERRGSDQTTRLLQVIAIVDELESGRYPDSKWVRDAFQLVTGFFVADRETVTYEPGNIERTLAAYQRFLETHFDPATASQDLIDSGLGYVITSAMVPLFERLGDADARLEATLAGLERLPGRARAIQLFRGQYWNRLAVGGPEGSRDLMHARAEAALRDISGSGSDYYARKAAATLAGLRLFRRDYFGARRAFDDYVSRFPDSPFAWVARVRAADSALAMGDVAAPDMLTMLARTEEAPLGRVVAGALAGRALDAAGRTEQALAAYRMAFESWPPVIGGALSATAYDNVYDRTWRVTRTGLAERVATLERLVGHPAAAQLQKALSLIEAGQPSEAVPLLEQALARARHSPAERDTLSYLRRAHLEVAMAAMADDRGDIQAARTALDKITDTPFDQTAALAGLAKATLLHIEGNQKEAAEAASTVLKRWAELQPATTPGVDASPLEHDARSVSAAVFEPGNGFSLLKRLFGNEPPGSLTPVMTQQSDVRVVTSDGHTSTLHIRDAIPGSESTVFLTIAEVAVAARVATAFAGGQRRRPLEPGAAATRHEQVLKFWQTILPARQGNWGMFGWSTFPTVYTITFLNSERTRAIVGFSYRHYAATMILEKSGGRWRAMDLVNIWMS